jgi:hypothetical protein
MASSVVQMARDEMFISMQKHLQNKNSERLAILAYYKTRVHIKVALLLFVLCALGLTMFTAITPITVFVASVATSVCFYFYIEWAVVSVLALADQTQHTLIHINLYLTLRCEQR